MRWVITEPGGVAEALGEPDERYLPEPDPSCVSKIAETAGFSRLERLDVYAEGYYLRILNSLREDYLAVARWLGDDEFRCLISDFLLDHPSRTPELLEAGRALPKYLPDWLERGRAPFLAPLAHLEWAMALAYFAPNAAPWDPKALTAADPERLGYLKLEAAPATDCLDSEWKLLELRKALRAEAWTEESPRPEILNERERLVIYRDGFTPKAESVSEPEFRLVQWAMEGISLGLACERFSELAEPEQLFEWLAKWAGRGVIACRG
jgi:hypothetical protein